METKNDITELRSILFETIRGLKNRSIDTEQAKAINDTAQVIINSAKIEVDRYRTSLPVDMYTRSDNGTIEVY